MTLYLTLFVVLSIVGGVVIGKYLKDPNPPLSPFQQVFADAKTLLLTRGLHAGDFTPIGIHGIGSPQPHDVIAAIAACDPDWVDNTTLYDLATVQHIRNVAITTTGIFPEVINDRMDLEVVLHLLDDCIEFAKKG